ncbi:MAG: hypothetical protein JNM72_18430 [Deltaproteobacteria bacterium]|jgi:hypothetical protein|nr:hypothetical protein [Deltaproteobacteria bacterium]
MLAGRVKLKTFLAGAAGGLLLLCAGVVAGGGALTLGLRGPPTPPPTTLQPVAVEAQPAVAPLPAAPEAAVVGDGLRDVDRDAMSWRGKALKSDKGKDVSAKRPYKINVYQDSGNKTVNRLKIDLDRDDKWDEKWDFDGEELRRQVAPADDEQYTQTFRWSGNGWVAAD